MKQKDSLLNCLLLIGVIIVIAALFSPYKIDFRRIGQPPMFIVEADTLPREAAIEKIDRILAGQDAQRIQAILHYLKFYGEELVKDSPLFDSLLRLYVRADKFRPYEDSDLVKYDVIHVLNKSGDDRLEKFLISLRKDKDPQTRDRAEYLLKELKIQRSTNNDAVGR